MTPGIATTEEITGHPPCRPELRAIGGARMSTRWAVAADIKAGVVSSQGELVGARTRRSRGDRSLASVVANIGWRDLPLAASLGTDLGRRVRLGQDVRAGGLAIAVLLLDPVVIVIGGGLARSADLLLEPVSGRLVARLPLRESPPVRAAAFGDCAGCIGAGTDAIAREQPAEPAELAA